MRHVRLAAAALAALGACAAPEHTNPFDPETPPSLQVRATLSGTISLEAIGPAAPVLTGIHVSVPGAGSADTDAAGQWALPNVAPGTYSVRASRTGYLDGEASGLVVGLDDGEKTVTAPAIHLAAARGGLAGQVLLAGSASAGGVLVSLQGAEYAASALTDAAGAFGFAGLPVGTYAVTLGKEPDWQPLTVSGVEVGTGASAALPGSPRTLSPVATASLSGAALLEGGGDASGTTVSLSGVDFRGQAVSATAPTAAGGAWSFTGLAAGSYQVALSRARFDAPAPQGVSLATGQALALPAVTLATSRGTVAGTVALSAGTVTGLAVGSDFSGAVVTLTGTDVPVPATVTDASGAYRFTGVPVSLAGAAFTVTATRAFYLPASTSILAAPNATASAPPLTLAARPATLQGTALLRDNVGGLGQNATSAGVAIAVAGTAFNGTAYARTAASGANGTWSIASLPSGTYDVVATSADRTCGAYGRVTLPDGATASAGSVDCADAVPPGAVLLGAPTPPDGAQAGYTNLSSVVVPIATPAADGTLPLGNFRGYELVQGPTPEWATASLVPGQPGSLTFSGLAANARSTLWVRAVDWVGNAGPASSLQVVHDGVAPPAPAISTPRLVVNATSTSAGLTGSESDANFHAYEQCTTSVPATQACPALPGAGCAFAATGSSVAVSLAADQKTCLYARARDKAGNVSPAALAAIVSDLTAPTGPSITPRYDPLAVTVHADWVDFQLTAPATDMPAGGATAWQDVAWLEVDTGSGFTPLCPQAACHAGNRYNPCSCGCTDARMVCSGTSLTALRMPLNGGTANNFAVRAVDVAGNAGSGVSQQVQTSGVSQLVAISGSNENAPRVRGRTLAWSNDGAGRVTDLGLNQRWDAGDATCAFGITHSFSFSFAPLDSSTLLYSTGSAVRVRRAGAGGWCTGDTEVDVGAASGAGWAVYAVAATFDPATGRLERAAWAENDTTGRRSRIWTRDPGAGGKLDGAGAPAPVLVADLASFLVTGLYLGGDALLYRGGNFTYVQDIDGLYTLLVRPAGGWVSPTPSTLSLAGATPALAAAIDSTGTLLAWVANDPAQTLHVRSAGPDGVLGSGDDLLASRTYGPSVASYAHVAVEAGHVVVAEYSASSGTGTLDHWTAGPNGVFEDAGDDTFARILPSPNARRLPSLGSGLSGGVVYFNAFSGTSWDVHAADLSALRWETVTDRGLGVYPASNRAGTLFFRRQNGVWARAADGQESYSGVDMGFYAASGDVFVGHNAGNVTLWQPDASGRFFTAAAPAPVTLLAGKAGASFVFSSIAIGAGGGNAIAAGCEANTTGTCTAGSMYLFVPGGSPPSLSTPAAIRLDTAAAFTGGSVLSNSLDGAGVSAWHAAWDCLDAASARRICVREPGVNGVFEGAGDDVSFYLHLPGTATPYAGASPNVSGHRIAFFSGGNVVVVDAGPDGHFNTADDVATIVGPSTTGQGLYLDLAGDFVAWMSAHGTNGIQAWEADLRYGTRRQLSDHFSTKYSVAVDPSGRVVWEDQVFPQGSVFVSSP